MSKKAALSLTALSLALGGASVFAQSETAAEGFIEGSTLSLINRNFYFNRDFRDGENATGNGYSEEWAHGLMAFFESGYTQGSVGSASTPSPCSASSSILDQDVPVLAEPSIFSPTIAPAMPRMTFLE